MTKSYIIKKLILLPLVALGFTSCLEKYPDDAILADKAITTLEEANQAVLGIYAEFKSPSLYSGSLTLLPDIQSDLVYAVDGFSNIYGDIWRWEILANNTEITSIYGTLYSIIGKCNFFFDNLPSLREKLDNDEDFENLKELEGEAHFARALAYSELIKLFCKAYDPATAADELGVVLVSSYHNPGKITRSSLKDSYQFVLDDLKIAEELIQLDETNNAVYFSKSLVNALYARIYLYMQDWNNAILYSSKVIDDKYLALANAATRFGGTAQSEFQYMWTNDSSAEIIWKVGFTSTSYGGALGRVFLNYNYVSFTPDYVPANWALKLYPQDSDLRFSTYFSVQETGYNHKLQWPLLVKYLGNESFMQIGMLHINMPKVFRLAEQYLIRAEAYCMTKQFSNASNDLSALRSARSVSSAIVSVNESNWFETLSKERVKELFMEGFRLQDLKRWHKGFKREPQSNSVKSGSSLEIQPDDIRFVWPIPQHELNSPDSDIQPNESNQ